ncbi:MAG: 3'-5' exonuclease domain-containing protein 2 [Odoribacteraceae bacterium]|jgi:ribonuclease D|nr:3'-5' exonuclease domain-containing protein 2 [Odoribacteraceae bacterium]
MNMQAYKKNITTEEIEAYPAYLYPGEIVVVENANQVERAACDLAAQDVIGFDTETRPSFTKGVVHPVGLMQLSTNDRVYLFRLNKYGLPAPLRELLSREETVKVGVGIRDDIRALRRLSDFSPASFVDLQRLVRAFGIEEMSFSKLMSIIFRVRISKRQRTSNWEAAALTPAQVRYAATDAWGSLKMYQALRSDEAPGASLP